MLIIHYDIWQLLTHIILFFITKGITSKVIGPVISNCKYGNPLHVFVRVISEQFVGDEHATGQLLLGLVVHN